MLKIPSKVPEVGFYYNYKHDPLKGIRDYAYEVIGVGFHTEDGCRPEDACMVDYRPLYEQATVYKASLQMGIPAIDHRPIDMFMEDVQKEGEQVPRFARIEDSIVIAKLEIVRMCMYEKWNPDPVVLAELAEEVSKHEDTDRHFSLGKRLLKWSDILEEVKNGTRFGRSYYPAFCESIAHSKTK